MIHHESATRGIDDDAEKRARAMRELQILVRRWAAVLGADPAYSPNLTAERFDFSLAWPPRH
jgi:hypothetical protein